MSVYVIGDSISIQYGPYLESYLKTVMDYSRKEGVEEALLNLDNPQGANGGDSSMVLSYLTSKFEIGGIDAEYLLLNCGLHDIKRNPETKVIKIGIDSYKKNLEAILELVQKNDKKLVWIRTTPVDEKRHNRNGIKFFRYSEDCHAYNKVADELMKKNGIPSIDLYTFTTNLGDDVYCDHVHFHDHVREKQAAFIAGWLTAFMN